MSYFALCIWPVIGIVLFRTLALPTAIVATILGGFLLLPPGFGVNFPLLPTFDKFAIPTLTALVLALIFARKDQSHALPGWLPRSRSTQLLTALVFVGIFGTVLTNQDTFQIGGRVFRGLSMFDAFSELQQTLIMLIPFVLARKFLATPESHRMLLWVLVISLSAYSVLALYEVRMSPQLNNMVYGFFPHDWKQHLRNGSWRPIVFMPHGLWLGIMLACATLAAFGLWNTEHSGQRKKALLAGVWLGTVTLLSQNLGALIIVLALLPALLFLPSRLQILAAAGIATIILSYPMLRAADLIPIDQALSAAEKIDPGRASSLRFRIENEDILLEKAVERPVFGWGGWSRSRVFNEQGQDVSITDGAWVILLGLGGWVKYLGELGLLAVGTLLLAFRWRWFRSDPATAAVSLVLTANIIYLIPNTGVSPLTWLLAGALAGRLELDRVVEKEGKEARTPEARSALVHVRSHPDDTASPNEARSRTEAPRFTRFEVKPRSRP